MEELYYLESQDFLVDREKVYLRKDKSMKLNSYFIGVSRLRVNNDKLLYLFNGLRGYYDVRSRYFKEPKIFENRVPFSKKILVNEYFKNKYKYYDMLIYSLSTLNRPTITIKKEEGEMHYSFPSRLVEFLNKQREYINAVESNKQFYKDVRQIKNIGFRFYLNPKRKYNRNNYKKVKLLSSIALGVPEAFLKYYSFYTQRKFKNFRRIKRRVKFKKYFLYKKRKKRRKLGIRKKKFRKTPKYLRLLFVVANKYLQNKVRKIRKKKLKTRAKK